jgi:MYXO-CTERM domain-containing protein
VVDPDGQRVTLAQGLTVSGAASPWVEAASPASAALGVAQTVTLTGEDFASGAAVFVGDLPATEVVVVSPTQLTATFPGLGAGSHSVRVVNPNGQSGTAFSAYAVVDPSRLEVLAPSAGARWTAGSTQAISWTAEGTAEVGIRLYKGGKLVSELAAAVDAGTGQFSWAIPAGLEAGADYAVQLFTPRGTAAASSAGSFSIVPAPLDTRMALESSDALAQPGQGLQFTATLTPADAEGSVQFSVDGVALGGPVAVSGGIAVSAETGALDKGSHTVLATFTGSGPCAGASATYVQAVNTPPQALPQAVFTPADTAKAITLAGTDADGDLLSFALASPPAHGTLTGTPPDLRYTPEAGYAGPDDFAFVVNDGQADSALAHVALDVGPRSDAAGLTATGGAVGCSATGDGSGSLLLLALLAAFFLARPRAKGPLAG